MLMLLGACRTLQAAGLSDAVGFAEQQQQLHAFSPAAGSGLLAAGRRYGIYRHVTPLFDLLALLLLAPPFAGFCVCGALIQAQARAKA